MTRFEIEGDPVAWARTRGSGSKRFTPAKQRTYKNRVVLAAKRAGVECIESGPVGLHVEAWFAHAKSKHRKREPLAECWHTQKPDADNVLKMIKDAMNGLAYTDDAQCCRAFIQKRTAPQGEPARVVVEVWRLEE